MRYFEVYNIEILYLLITNDRKCLYVWVAEGWIQKSELASALVLLKAGSTGYYVQKFWSNINNSRMRILS